MLIFPHIEPEISLSTKVYKTEEKVVQNAPFEDAPLGGKPIFLPLKITKNTLIQPILGVNAIPESEIDQAPLLNLKIIEGPNLNQTYTMNACGLIGLQGRGRNDGCILVGSQDTSPDSDEAYNDIVLSQEDNNEIGKRHF